MEAKRWLVGRRSLNSPLQSLQTHFKNWNFQFSSNRKLPSSSSSVPASITAQEDLAWRLSWLIHRKNFIHRNLSWATDPLSSRRFSLKTVFSDNWFLELSSSIHSSARIIKRFEQWPQKRMMPSSNLKTKFSSKLKMFSPALNRSLKQPMMRHDVELKINPKVLKKPLKTYSCSSCESGVLKRR